LDNTTHTSRSRRFSLRRGAILLTAAWALPLAVGVMALSVEFGSAVLIRSQLQTVADEAALAAAETIGFVPRHGSDGPTNSPEVQLGLWCTEDRTFRPITTAEHDAGVTPNAVRAKVIRETGTQPVVAVNGSAGRLRETLPRWSATDSAEAVAALAPRDIVLVVSLAGAMNDDSNPCRQDDPRSSEAVQHLFDDLGFGPYPGASGTLGQAWGIAESEDAYAALTADDGPLAGDSVAPAYRIHGTDGEVTRRHKAYAAIIDRQIARLMPAAVPAPDSAVNFAYWEKYLDYVVRPSSFQNEIGYRTYTQFLLDQGRDLQVVPGRYSALSVHGPDCPRHEETVAGRTFSFPPRTEPMHSTRRALIHTIGAIARQNASIPDSGGRDRVSVISFDSLFGGGPIVRQSLTDDYEAAMIACTQLQAAGDKGASNAVEAGLLAASNHLQAAEPQGRGWPDRQCVVILVAGQTPDAFVSPRSEIDASIADDPLPGFFENAQFNGGAHHVNGPLLQARRMGQDGWRVSAVGVGRRIDADFLNRLTRMGTDATDSEAPRAEVPQRYEQHLTESFERILADRQVHLVQ